MPPRIAVVACRVFEQELAVHARDAGHIAEIQFLEVGLHDHPPGLRSSLQAQIDALDARGDIEAVVLAYALCGLGTAGLRAGNHPLVIPRAHDCITLFLGSKEAFAREQSARPDTYYYTPGWMQANRTPGPDRLESLRAELSQKFEPDDVEFLIASEQEHWAQHGRAVFLDLGTPGAEDCAQKAGTAARSLGWEFERIPGNPSLLADLLAGNWDDARFQTVQPGTCLAHSADPAIFRSAPARPV